MGNWLVSFSEFPLLVCQLRPPAAHLLFKRPEQVHPAAGEIRQQAGGGLPREPVRERWVSEKNISGIYGVLFWRFFFNWFSITAKRGKPWKFSGTKNCDKKISKPRLTTINIPLIFAKVTRTSNSRFTTIISFALFGGTARLNILNRAKKKYSSCLCEDVAWVVLPLIEQDSRLSWRRRRRIHISVTKEEEGGYPFSPG